MFPGREYELDLLKGCSIRPVLIYHGKLSDFIKEEDYFDKTICFDDLLLKSQ